MSVFAIDLIDFNFDLIMTKTGKVCQFLKSPRAR